MMIWWFLHFENCLISRGIKNVHQDFVIVFAITFAVIVVIIVFSVLIYHIIKKCNSFISTRKNIPNLYVTTEAGTIIYEKEPASQEPTYQESAADALEKVDEIVADVKPNVISSRERRKRFAENRSKTSQVSSYSGGERCDSCSHSHHSQQSQHGSSSHLQDHLQSQNHLQTHLSSQNHLHHHNDRGLYLPLVTTHDHHGRRHTCTLESHRVKQNSSFEKKTFVPKQLSLQY